jgi:hypothetical protein
VGWELKGAPNTNTKCKYTEYYYAGIQHLWWLLCGSASGCRACSACCLLLLLLGHDISTEVFGRAYLAVRAGYFTH